MSLIGSKCINLDERCFNPDKIFSFHIPCYVCGELTKGLYILYTKRKYCSDAHFPFLETHKPPKSAIPMEVDGSIAACFCCFSFLSCQWNLYENKKVPYAKRIYWLKRTDGQGFSGILVGSQSEYASQILGLSSEQLPNFLESNNDIEYPKGNKKIKAECDIYSEIEMQSEALDLSVESNNAVASPNSSNRKSATDWDYDQLLNVQSDVSMSAKSDTSIVCSICEIQCENYSSESLVSLLAITSDNGKENQYLKFLQKSISPNNKSNSFDFIEGLKICDLCSTKLHLVHAFYDFKDIKNENRNYYFKGHFSSKAALTCVSCNTKMVDLSKKCNNVISTYSGMRLNSSNYGNLTPTYKEDKNYSRKSYTDWVQELVDLCCNCYQLICSDPLVDKKFCSSDCSLTNKSYGNYYVDRMLFEKYITNCEGNDGPTVACDFCSINQNVNDMEKLFILDINNAKKTFFPSLRYLTLLDSSKIHIDYMLSCISCYDIFYKYYLSYKKFGSISNKLFSTLSYLAIMLDEMAEKSSNKKITMACMKPFHKQTIESQITVDQLVRKTEKSKVIECVDIGNASLTFCFENGIWNPLLEKYEIKLVSTESVKLPLKALQNPLDIGVNCFICGHFSNAGCTYVVRSNDYTSVKLLNCPNMWKNDEIGLVCAICFHSLVSQRQEFENSDIPYGKRKYLMSWYFCYVCSAGTFRNRLHLLLVKAFPFILKHSPTKKGIVANGGNHVVVCRDCYETLNSQYLEMERLRVPVEMRQYNWIKRPPPAQEQQQISSSIPSNAEGSNLKIEVAYNEVDT